jgi:uncharacterized SAM-binding protein YcdF (DUF218 family)
MFFRNYFASSGAESSDTRHLARRSNNPFPLLFLLAAALCFFNVGAWLVVEDPLEHAQAIVVLSGRMPMRALEAAKLYRAGYAPEVWLTRSNEPAKSLQAMGVEYYGEEYYNSKILVHEGVPAAAIRVLEPAIVNTADEIATIKAALNATPQHTAILVTTKPHTRRVRALWRAVKPDATRAIVRATTFDPYDGRHWWRTTRDALDVVREVLGLLNAWAGLPLSPS